MLHELKGLSDSAVRYLHALLLNDGGSVDIEEKINDIIHVRQCKSQISPADAEHLCDEINKAYHNIACDNPDCPVHHPKGH